ncbi:MAG TPA: VOC family protein [Candidatus Deferrimicrobiaceae bacterium]
MLNLNSVMIFSENPAALSEFYKKIFAKNPDMEEGGFYGYQVGAAFMGVGPHDRVKGSNPAPERILLNFQTAEVKAEFERIKGMGARVVAEPYQMGEGKDFWIATFADPDGNYFQLMSPWKDGK